MATTVTDPLLGQVVDGRYEVLSRVARGGMATVYRALDRRLDREVALKVMHPHLADGHRGADFVARFRREARAAARLSHPALVAVYDQGVDGETSYLAMELVPGSTLRQHLEDSGPLPVDEALATAEQVLEALAVAHRAGLVHRDIKPENVLLDLDGRIKVTDFGLARAVTEVTATSTGTVLGTVAYLAPELVSTGSSDTRTDVYAVGILLYEMLTGAQPFTGETPVQVAYRHVHEDVPAPSDVASWFPAELDDLVASLTARDPDERPTDAHQALALLRRARATLGDDVLSARSTAGVPGDAPTSPRSTEATDLAATAVMERSRSTGATTGVSLIGPAPADAPTGSGRTPVGVVADGPPHETADDTGLRRWRRGVGVLLALIGLVAAAGIGMIWWSTTGPGAWTTVPTDLVGQPLPAATATLDDAGLAWVTEETFDPEAPAGAVLAAEPTEGEAVRRDGSVSLLVSLGPDLRPVPELVGLPEDGARTALADVDLEVGEVGTEHHDSVPEGEVLASSSGPEEELPVGSPVDLVLSAGPAPVTVISVVGVPEQEAVAQLEADGLQVDRTEAYGDDHPAGVVAAQDPAPRNELRRGDTIQITVSLGPPLVEVPGVMRNGTQAAVDTLEAAGFTVEVQRATAYFGLGFVVGQYPEGGESIPRGSTVTITIT